MKTKPKQSTLTALEALEEAIRITGDGNQRREGEFTTQEYADRIKMGVHASRRMLNDAVRAGKLVVRKTSRNYFYSIA